MRPMFLAAALLPLITVCTAAQKPSLGPVPQRDVFVVGPDTAIGDPLLGFKPTRVEFTQEPMDAAGRRELLRNLLMEQGFAHRSLPLGAPGLTLHANGKLTVEGAELKQRMFKNGMTAAAGDRILVTDVVVLPDRINIDVNGGPYLPHRFLRHISINDIPLAGDGQVGERATGTRITLLFEGRTPRVSAAEVKALLEPLLDFGIKSSEQAYADTLPEPIRKAIAEHEVLVGMNRRMVLAALGQPESKLRERASDGKDGEVFEEWVYGKTPQTIRFLRFRADRLVLVKIAALGKPIDVRDKDELAGYRDPALLREVSLGGDSKAASGGEDTTPRKAPSLRDPSEKPAGDAPAASPKKDVTSKQDVKPSPLS